MDNSDHVHMNELFIDRMTKMEKHNILMFCRIEKRMTELEIHMQSMEERLRDYLETALTREDAANQRADRAEKRRLPHWADMPRT